MTPPTLSGQAQATRATMVRLLADGTDALAGYPAASLIRGCWRPSCAGVSVRGVTLAACVLQAWTRQLDQSLAGLAPGTGPAIERMRRQISATRSVLGRLQACVASLHTAGAPPSPTTPSPTPPAPAPRARATAAAPACEPA